MSGRFDIAETPLGGLTLVQRKPVGDSRGYLERLYCSEELKAVLAGKGIVQINGILTAKTGTVRGMHFQFPPYAETKIVSCLRGEVFDVAIDLRRGSPTFLQWHGEILSPENHRTLIIPEGFAHGFQTLGNDCEMLYFHTAAYRHEAYSGCNPRDPRLAIRWPLPISDLSDRDVARAMLDPDFEGVVV